MPQKKQQQKSADEPIDQKNKYAATAWGSNAEPTVDLEVPSGQLCLVRRPGVQGLLSAGLLHDLDILTSIVQVDQIDRVKKPADRQKSKKSIEDEQKAQITALMKDPRKIDSLLHTVDRVICHVVLQPEIKMTPNDATSRERNVIYADMVDLEDKMFIFQYVVGGTGGVEQFRAGSAEAVGTLDDVEDDEGSSE